MVREGAARHRITLALEVEHSRTGKLHISLLPGGEHNSHPYPLLDLRERQVEGSLAPVRLIEGYEYLYELELPGETTVSCYPPELFFPDDISGLRGRLRTGLYTGTVMARFEGSSGLVGSAAFEVRSRKLDYLNHYSWMLRDIAEQAAAILMHRFAPSTHTFLPEPNRNPDTAYEQFAFLQSLVRSQRFRAAISYIMANPHSHWEMFQREHPIGRGTPGRSVSAKSLSRPGPRVPSHMPHLHSIKTLPKFFPVISWDTSIDVPENRFVKYVLSTWRDFAQRVNQILKEGDSNPGVERGLRETSVVVSELDQLLAEPLFRQIGVLTFMPDGSQILQGREGYRELFRMFLEFLGGSVLAWPGGQDIYRAGKRDVARLYEIWVFMQMVSILSSLSGGALDYSQLFQLGADGLQLTIRGGKKAAISGGVERLGRRLLFELWYNKTFHPHSAGSPSWTGIMRPDISIRISDASPNIELSFREVWIHFDAKYRIEELSHSFGYNAGEPVATEDSNIAARRGDLLKMHAYRDAIRRSVGAYVIYPGTDELRLRQYHELLPGLGAFPMIPSEDSHKTDHDGLIRFLCDVIDHVSSQFTQHERARYWVNEAYQPGTYAPEGVRAAPFINVPPADVPTLLGYVRGRAHYRWIKASGRYNIRADERTGSVQLGGKEFAAQIVVLYGSAMGDPEIWRVTGEPKLMTRPEMAASGYPDPRGANYVCFPIEPIPLNEIPIEPVLRVIQDLRAHIAGGKPWGAPVVTTWFEFIAAHKKGAI